MDIENEIYVKMPPVRKYTIRMKIIKILHGSAISNAYIMMHSSHDIISYSLPPQMKERMRRCGDGCPCITIIEDEL